MRHQRRFDAIGPKPANKSGSAADDPYANKAGACQAIGKQSGTIGRPPGYVAAQHCARSLEVPLFQFMFMPAAVEAVPTHTWLHDVKRDDGSQSRAQLRTALRQAERRVIELRSLLNPDM